MFPADPQKQYADAVIEVLPTQLIPGDDDGKVPRVRLIMKEGVKHFAPVYLFDEGSTISWVPCGRKLSCSYPGIKFAYGFGTYFGHEVMISIGIISPFLSTLAFPFAFRCQWHWHESYGWFWQQVSVLEMDGRFDKLDELIYVETHLSNLSAKFYGEVTQQMLTHADLPGSNNGTGLFQTIVGLKIRELCEHIVAMTADDAVEV